MKPINWIVSWTTRNLKWLLPFCVVMPFVLWWWNAHIDRIGYWLWLAIHGQKGGEIEAGVTVAVVLGAVVWLVYLAIVAARKEVK